jgi:hypothetical protein
LFPFNGGIAERLRRMCVVDISENAVDRISQLIHRLKLQMSGTSPSTNLVARYFVRV